MGITRRRLLIALMAQLAISETTNAGATIVGSNGRLTYAVGTGAYFEVGVTGSGVINAGENSRAPAWSPIEAEVVYNTLGGLVVRNIDGSNPTTLGPGTDPAWSPDGTQIVYTPSFSQPLAITGRDGTPSSISLPEGDSPAWSPDGQALAYYRGGAIWTFDLASGTETSLVLDGHDLSAPATSCASPVSATARIAPSTSTRGGITKYCYQTHAWEPLLRPRLLLRWCCVLSR